MKTIPNQNRVEKNGTVPSHLQLNHHVSRYNVNFLIKKNSIFSSNFHFYEIILSEQDKMLLAGCNSLCFKYCMK